MTEEDSKKKKASDKTVETSKKPELKVRKFVKKPKASSGQPKNGASSDDIKMIEKTLNADKIIEETQGAKANEAEDAYKQDKDEVDRLS